ncbi:MAG: hypothetical protein V1837_01345 [Candidatus Woesearchaeota archaeon]
MKEVELNNPLTIEERLSLPRLCGHDSMTYFAVLSQMPAACKFGGKDFDSKQYHAVLDHLSCGEAVIEALSQYDCIFLTDAFYNTRLDKASIERLISDMGQISYDVPLQGSVQEVPRFLTLRPLMHSVVFNLVKNGGSAQRSSPDFGKAIEVAVEPSVFPDHSVFIPENATKYSHFIVFKVRNAGRPFPESPEYYFQRSIPEKGDGFGLHFVKMASKYLRAPVDIISKPGDTIVSFYHPVY